MINLHRTIPRMALAALLTTALAVPGPSGAQEIDNRRGSDPRVDYGALTQRGPWDDRNFLLTAEDLALLSSNELEIGGASLPAFFQVEMHKANPNLGKNGTLYPRSALQIFFQKYGGYQINGQHYRRVRLRDGRYHVLADQKTEEGDWLSKALTGEARITSPVGDEESAIKIHPTDPDLVIAGSNDASGGQTMHFSTNGGATWTQAAALPTWDTPLGFTCCDPTVDWSSDGSFAYTATLGGCEISGCNVWFYRSSDGGQSWMDLQVETGILNVRREITSEEKSDKEYLHVDKSALSPFKDRLYLTWHDDNVMKVASSGDFGNTWSSPATVSSGDSQKGIGSDIATNRHGHVYYAWASHASNRILMARSLLGGTYFDVTFEVAGTIGSYDFPIPAMETRRAFIYPSIDVDLTTGPYSNRIYIAWTDNTVLDQSTPSLNHARIRVASSADGGANWTVTTPHEDSDFLTVDRFHPWLSVDAMGTVHVIYYDTQNSASRQGVDVYHARSHNGGASWSAPVRLTTVTSPHIEDAMQWGDYNGLDVVGNLGVSIFTDNRNEGGGSADSKDIYAAAASPVRKTLFISNGAEDGRISETIEVSSVGGAFVASDNSTSGLRVGDTASKQQTLSILSFDTASIPDNAVITEVELRVRRGTLVGSLAGLGNLRAEIKTGFYGASSALTANDFESVSSFANVCTLTIPAADGDFAECVLNLGGLASINKVGLTQFRLKMTTDDDNDAVADYMGFYGGEATVGFLQFLGPQLIVTYEPP